jgi:hypothetical protein
MRNDVINDDLIRAARDFVYLMNQYYPRKTILKIVGDRYLLNTFQRILLSRGIFRDEVIQLRIQKTIKKIDSRSICIDAYNVFFTISNYLLGRMVFVSNDRFLRDAGEVYGKLHKEPVFTRAIDMTMYYLKRKKPSRVEFLLDKPISHSAELAGKLRFYLEGESIPGDAQIDKNPDAVLIRQSSGIIATSDSDILDETELPIVDLAHLVLADNFSLDLPDLGKLLS